MLWRVKYNTNYEDLITLHVISCSLYLTGFPNIVPCPWNHGAAYSRLFTGTVLNAQLVRGWVVDDGMVGPSLTFKCPQFIIGHCLSLFITRKWYWRNESIGSLHVLNYFNLEVPYVVMSSSDSFGLKRVMLQSSIWLSNEQSNIKIWAQQLCFDILVLALEGLMLDSCSIIPIGSFLIQTLAELIL